MTQKQMMTLISLWFLTIAGFGFSSMVTSFYSECDSKYNRVNYLAGDQDRWLYSYGFFNALKLDEDSLNKMRAMINMNGKVLKSEMEEFKNECESRQYNNKVAEVFEGYKYHLQAKQALFDEDQTEGLKWVNFNLTILRE